MTKMKRGQYIIGFLALGAVILILGLMWLFMQKNSEVKGSLGQNNREEITTEQSGEDTGNEVQTDETVTGKATVPGPENTGPQGPALLPTEESDTNEEE